MQNQKQKILKKQNKEFKPTAPNTNETKKGRALEQNRTQTPKKSTKNITDQKIGRNTQKQKQNQNVKKKTRTKTKQQEKTNSNTCNTK